MARVSTNFLLRPPHTRLWDRIPRILWDTLADESFSPRLGPDVPAPRHGGGGEAGRPLRPAPGTLAHSGRPRRPSGTDGLLQRPGGGGGGQASPASVRGGPGRPLGRGLARRTNFGGELFPLSHGHTIAWKSRIGPPSCRSRTTQIRQGHVPPDGLQPAPPKGRRGKALIGTTGPMDSATVQSSSDGGQDLCRQGTGHIPSRRTCWRISGRFWRRGQADQLTANPSSWTSCTAWR